MVNDDLFNLPSIQTVKQLCRGAAVLAAVLLAIGAAGVGAGRTVDQRRPAAAASAQSALPAEAQAVAVQAAATLPPDLDPSDRVATPAVAMPSLVAPPRGRLVMMEVTAYCPCSKCCGRHANGITASGKLIDHNSGRFVAADTDVLPFGTKLLVPGYCPQPVEVIDRGGAIRGNRLDVFFPTHAQALEWGRRMVAVTVIE